MKTMKKLVTILLTVLVFTSCSKEEDLPEPIIEEVTTEIILEGIATKQYTDYTPQSGIMNHYYLYNNCVMSYIDLQTGDTIVNTGSYNVLSSIKIKINGNDTTIETTVCNPMAGNDITTLDFFTDSLYETATELIIIDRSWEPNGYMYTHYDKVN